MSLSVSDYGHRAVVYQVMQPQAAGASDRSPARTEIAQASHAASPPSGGARGIAVSDALAAFLSGLVSGGPLAAEPAQNPMSPALADSSSATPAAAASSSAAIPAQPAPASDVRATPSAAASSSADAPAPSDGLGVVLAAYVSNMAAASTRAEADPASAPASRATVSASAAAVSHPGNHAHVRDHASPRAATSTAGASAAAA